MAEDPTNDRSLQDNEGHEFNTDNLSPQVQELWRAAIAQGISEKTLITIYNTANLISDAINTLLALTPMTVPVQYEFREFLMNHLTAFDAKDILQASVDKQMQYIEAFNIYNISIGDKDSNRRNQSREEVKTPQSLYPSIQDGKPTNAENWMATISPTSVMPGVTNESILLTYIAFIYSNVPLPDGHWNYPPIPPYDSGSEDFRISQIIQETIERWLQKRRGANTE